ncbi:hypothetical protein ACJIZ3_007592 [Penstemon smallii]|uniref:CCHC-type domain-containing protein n=1 Tax=Penstemon smallii TaxID=265156 RepID=A0ABD3T8A9_9LAMI
MVTIHDFNGTNMVSIRDFYKKEGKMHPSRGVNSGITLPPNQWSSFRNSFPSIQEAISKLESRARFEAVAKQSVETVAKQSEAAANSVAASAAEISQIEAVSSDFTNTVRSPINKNHTEANTSKCVTAPNSQEHTSADRKQEEMTTSNSHEEIAAGIKPTESDICTLAPEFPNPGKFHYTPDLTHAIQLIPIQPSRFDGRNYHSWRLHMEMFLNQLNLSYVLFEPCPSISSNPEASLNEKVQVQSATQRWIKDDYMCRDNILKSLCDSLFQSYSQKTYSAKELWEELKLVYSEDFGTNRSQINKYINFQMVDGVSILEQVQELHRIANTIMASGFSWIDENFHVSAIISKLPPSWKEFRVRLMHEEFLPVHILMHRLQVEEESRKNYKKESNYRKDQIRKKEYKKGCFRCGREGHVMKNCPDQRFEVCGKNNGKENGVLARDAIIVREENMA